MTKYTRETVYNSDGSVRKRIFKTNSVVENSIFDAETIPTPQDPIDPEVKFGRAQGNVIDREAYEIKNEIDFYSWQFWLEKIREYLAGLN